MNIAFLALISGVLRAAHGNGTIPRWLYIIALTVFVSLLKHLDLYGFIMLFLGLIAGLTTGWGKYFAATGLQPLNREETEVFFIDVFVDEIKDDTLAGMVGMSLRWCIFFIPLFFVFGHVFYSLFLLLMGPLYGLHRYHKNWFLTEFLSGALLGALLALI